MCLKSGENEIIGWIGNTQTRIGMLSSIGVRSLLSHPETTPPLLLRMLGHINVRSDTMGVPRKQGGN